MDKSVKPIIKANLVKPNLVKRNLVKPEINQNISIWLKILLILFSIIALIIFLVGIYFSVRPIDRTPVKANVIRIDGEISKKCKLISNEVKGKFGTIEKPAVFNCNVTLRLDDRSELLDIKYSGDKELYTGQELTVYVKNNSSSDISFEKIQVYNS